MQGAGCRVQGAGCRVQGAGARQGPSTAHPDACPPQPYFLAPRPGAARPLLPRSQSHGPSAHLGRCNLHEAERRAQGAGRRAGAHPPRGSMRRVGELKPWSGQMLPHLMLPRCRRKLPREQTPRHREAPRCWPVPWPLYHGEAPRFWRKSRCELKMVHRRQRRAWAVQSRGCRRPSHGPRRGRPRT